MTWITEWQLTMRQLLLDDIYTMGRNFFPCKPLYATVMSDPTPNDTVPRRVHGMRAIPWMARLIADESTPSSQFSTVFNRLPVPLLAELLLLPWWRKVFSLSLPDGHKDDNS